MLGPKHKFQTLLHVSGALALGCSLALAAPPIGTSSVGGKLILNDRGKAKIHTFAPAPLAATTHIIETAEGLVVIDAQQFVSGAQEAIAYVRSLNKPVRRLISNQRHPDPRLRLGRRGGQPPPLEYEADDICP